MWNWSENQIELVWIRHGATESNKEHRYLGKTDEGLSEEGMKELQELKDSGRYPKVEYVFSSPMKRCIETAWILYPDRKAILIPEWEEMDFGAFEGKNYRELQNEKRYQEWIDSNGTLPFPEGESREDFIRRCRNGFYRMQTQLLELICNFDNETQNQVLRVGMIVHGGTVMALLSSFCGGEYFDYQVANGKGYVCRLEGQSEKIKLTILEKL